MPAWPTWPSRPSWSWGSAERLGRALLEALTDPTAVLDAQGRIVAANQAWVRFAAKDLAGLALAEVGQSYPAACEAATPPPTTRASSRPPTASRPCCAARCPCTAAATTPQATPVRSR